MRTAAGRRTNMRALLSKLHGLRGVLAWQVQPAKARVRGKADRSADPAARLDSEKVLPQPRRSVRTKRSLLPANHGGIVYGPAHLARLILRMGAPNTATLFQWAPLTYDRYSVRWPKPFCSGSPRSVL